MSTPLFISPEDIIHCIKLSCQVPDLVEAIARQKIIVDAATEAGIKVAESELQQEGDRLRFARKLVKAADTLAWLKRHHLSVEDFEELVHKDILAKKLAFHLFADKVEAFFYQNKLNYFGAVTYEIIFDDRDVALELFYALQEGEVSFQEIAREYILNPEIRRVGGYQGIKRRGEFRPEIAAAVFAATPPEILKPITTPKGVYLILVEEIIQPELDERSRSNILQELFSDWLKQQIEKQEILIDLEGDKNSQPVQPLTQPA
ncbi:MAG: peptidylprolyl isomerase [Tolypothrix carrinoi HA7290-LM1]|jgi:parvulin-like peptidyl-prolyl isomerase|nr:peptidylprolyl isomerase [Tolypothrix carrinoi HA7290-LM1]